mgnify:CR=1 FL=1
MRVLTYDYETSYGANLPWIPGAYPVSLCAKLGDEVKTWVFNHSEVPYSPPDIKEIQYDLQKDKIKVVIGSDGFWDMIALKNDKSEFTDLDDLLNLNKFHLSYFQFLILHQNQ